LAEGGLGVMFGFHFIGWLTMLTISFFDIPILVSTNRAHIAARGGIGIAYVLNIAAMTFMCLVLWPTLTSPFPASDLKFGLLLFAGSEIVSLLLSHHIDVAVGILGRHVEPGRRPRHPALPARSSRGVTRIHSGLSVRKPRLTR
jgi:hypothetical protein